MIEQADVVRAYTGSPHGNKDVGSSLHYSGVYHFRLNRMWTTLENLPGDTYHAKATRRTPECSASTSLGLCG